MGGFDKTRPIRQAREKRTETMTTTILALDLGTTTGWALRGSDGHITSGSESFRPQRFEGGGMRFLRFKRWLTELKAITSGVSPGPSGSGCPPRWTRVAMHAPC